MLLFLLSLLSFLVPIVLLFFMGLEIYFRNREGQLNKIAAALFAAMTALLTGSFLTNLFPTPYDQTLTLYFEFIPAFFLMAFVLHFSLRLTPRYQTLGSISVFFLCYFPAFPVILLIRPPDWISLFIRENEIWKAQQPTDILLGIIIAASFYTFVSCLFYLVQGYRFVLRQPNLSVQRKQINMILLGVLTGGTWSIMAMIMGIWLQFPESERFPDISSFGVIIFAVFVRISMVRYGFLPPIEQKYKVLFELSPSPIMLLDKHLKVKDANPAAQKLFKLNCGARTEPDFTSFLAESSRYHLMSRILEGDKSIQGEWIVISSDDKERIVLSESEYIESEGEQLQYVIFRDITEKKQAEEQILYLAYHDELTGLANRAKFQKSLRSFVRFQDKGIKKALVFLDLDHFKRINDTKGHYVGDLLLIHVADQLKASAAEANLIARIGGDEFALIFEEIRGEEHAHRIGKALLEGLKKPFVYDNEAFQVSASMGICLFPDNGTESDVLMKHADIAMYHVKYGGKNNYSLFNDSMLCPDDKQPPSDIARH